MQITTDYIKNSFDKYNKIYFEGKLIRPLFKISRSKRVLGYFQVNNALFGFPIILISISGYYDRTEKEFDTTILHEMIHLYVYQNKLRDNGNHGRIWTQYANHINKDGWNIQAKHCGDMEVSSKYAKTPHYMFLVMHRDTPMLFRVSKNNLQLFCNHCKKHFDKTYHFVSYDANKFGNFVTCRNKIRGKFFQSMEDNRLKDFIQAEKIQEIF